TAGTLDSHNYVFTYAKGTLHVVKAAIVITVDDASKVYGGGIPVLTGSLSGVVNGDDITLTYSTTADQYSDVGTYPINAIVHDPGNKLGNYTVSNTPGTLHVTKAPLSVTADDSSKVYGDANPAFSASSSGFVLGQDPSVLGGALAFSTAATSSSPVGSYGVTPSGLTSSNYAITIVDGTLSITKAPLTVSAK